MNGARYYRDPLGRQIAVSLFDDAFSADVVDEAGEVVELIEGRQAQLDALATVNNWRLEIERVITP